MASVESDAAAAATDLATLSERLSDPSTYADGSLVRELVERHNDLRDRIDRLATERETLAAELEAAESDAATVTAGGR